jgi:hypothetical protein
MHWGSLTAGLFMMALVAGCVDDGADSGVPGCRVGTTDADGVNLVAPAADVLAVDQDPWDARATNYRTCTLEVVGRHDLRGGDPHRYIGEIDMRGDLDLGAVAVVGNGEAPTVYLLDITDRAAPVVHATIEQVGTYIVDVKISDDGDFLFTASQSLPAIGEVPIDPAEPAIFAGFTIYDIRDRTAPAFVQTVVSPDDIGCHMLSHEVIAGTDVVFCVGQQVKAHGFLRNGDGLPWTYLGPLLYFLPDGSGPVLPGNCVNDEILLALALGQVDGATGGATTPIRELLCNGPHDMTVRVDEVDQTTLMTVSHWNEGVRVVDVSAPVEDGFVTVGSWDGDGATHYDGNVHTAMTFWVGDTRYTMASPELTYAGVVPSLWVLDATDLAPGAQLPLVAEWYHPSEVETPGLLMTTHQWQVAPTGPDVLPEDVRVYLSWNHNGVWVLDFGRILAGDLAGAILGFHMARDALDADLDVPNAVLSTWDVNVVDGYIYGSDRATGLWIFHYTGDTLGDGRLTGFA